MNDFRHDITDEENDESGVDFTPCDRRRFLARAAQAGIALAAVGGGVGVPLISASKPAAKPKASKDGAIEVAFYKKLPEKEIECETCHRKCKVGDVERGFCGNKENRSGRYVTLAYGNPCALNVDPIEKKPLFHFLPGTTAFSLTEAGCNYDCKFCQNWDISQSRPEQARGRPMSPSDVADATQQSGARTTAYTYGEPTVYYEYARDCSDAVRRRGLRNVIITNGSMLPKPMKELLPRLDAVKIDFKAYTHRFYKNTCMGELKPVLDSIQLVHNSMKWLELVYLVVPTLNDAPSELKAMAKWMMKTIGPDVPIHFSRFHPTYKLKNLPITPIETLETARNICLDAGLHYVYIGNVPGHTGENTFCPGCKKAAIGRYGYTITAMNIDSRGKCGHCGKIIPGVWR